MPGPLSNKAPRANTRLGLVANQLRWSLRPYLSVLRRHPPEAKGITEEPVLTPGAARAFLRRAEWSFRSPPG